MSEGLGCDFRIFIDAATLKGGEGASSSSPLTTHFRIFIDAATLKEGYFSR